MSPLSQKKGKGEDAPWSYEPKGGPERGKESL